jgi:8-oxo-dGTP diphosphatase
MGELLRGLTTEAGAQLIVHGSVRAALRFRADGVHFPSSALANDREDVPPSLATGYSCHSRPELLQAIRRGATYAFLSPYSAPRSHETDLPALGASGFREAINGLPIPVLALGGMTPPLAREAMDAGAYGVAAITGLFHPGADCREWLDAVRAGDE